MIEYYTDILKRGEKRLKFPKIVFFGAKHARKSIISIRTTNYTFFKKSLKIEGFKSFFFLLDKTYDFWTNFSLDKRRGQERRKGQDRQDRRNGERTRKGAREKGGQGVYTPERGWGKIDYKHSHEKTENLNSLYCI